MGIKTGKPRGRPKGSNSKVTLARKARMQEVADKVIKHINGAFEGDSHEFLMTIYKNPQFPIPLRLDAAKAAISYEKPRLAAVEHSGALETKAAYECSDAELAALAFGSGSGTTEEAEGAEVTH
jgi:hypothetical protein